MSNVRLEALSLACLCYSRDIYGTPYIGTVVNLRKAQCHIIFSVQTDFWVPYSFYATSKASSQVVNVESGVRSLTATLIECQLNVDVHSIHMRVRPKTLLSLLNVIDRCFVVITRSMCSQET